LFLGSIFHTIKGGIDSVAIRKKLKECRDLLSRDELAVLKPYQRFLVQQRLLLTEYLYRCSQLKAKRAALSNFIDLKERMNLKMNELIQNAQQELESRPANKLDIAQLVSSIQQLSVAIDKDLDKFHKDLNKFNKDLAKYHQDLGNFKTELNNVKKEQRRQAGCLEELEDKIKLTSELINTEVERVNAIGKKRSRLIWGLNVLILIVLTVLIRNVLQ
jgi:chromosome segregation ATPase